MRIGLLLPGFSAGADDWAIPVQQHLVRTLAQTDDVRVLALRYPHGQQTYTLDDAQITSLGAGQVRGWKRLKLWRDALMTLRQMHRERPFDALHATWADETGLIAVWAGRMLGVPSVVSVVGGELARLDDIGYGLQRGVFSRWIVGQALRANRVICATRYTRQMIVRAGYTVPEARLCLIPLGVDADLFCPSSTPREADLLLHVGSLVPVKDQATLLKAVASLPDVRLDIIGTGREEMALRKLAGALEIERRVRFLGAVAHLELPNYYRRAALHVLSSRHEGQALVTLEAAACATPTVGTAVGILADDPALGVSVPVGDHTALAAAVSDLLRDSAHRETLGAAARAAVTERYTIHHTAEALKAVYARL